jgi:DNA-nicking Smr family endonuclease
VAVDRQKAADEEERRLFEAEMQGVRPLPPGSRRAVPDWDKVPAVSSAGAAPRPAQEGLHLDVDGEGITGAAFGVARALIRSLAKGEIGPEAELNLHHAPVHSAVHQTERFIEESVAKGRRCVLLIHGRGLHSGPGGPALRSALVEALGRRPLLDHVLAFTSAPPCHGGIGALLVLLRKIRSSRP